MSQQLASTTQRPAASLSSSYLVFHDKITTKGFHFKRKLFNGKWSSVARCSAEHVQRLEDLEDTIDSLMQRGK